MNSKAKGTRNELELAKLLTLTLKQKFSRVGVSSGARKGFNNSAAEEVFAGDIICPAEFPFSIECKSGHKLKSSDFFPNISQKVQHFFKQASDDAARVAKKPLLCCKIAGGIWICVVDCHVPVCNTYAVKDMKTGKVYSIFPLKILPDVCGIQQALGILKRELQQNGQLSAEIIDTPASGG